MINREVYVLYGSQTGNAESIAKDLADKLTCEGIATKCMELNQAKGCALKEQALCLLVVCSTTGNGDAPENTNEWWRSVKLRSVVSVSLLYFYYGSSFDTSLNDVITA